MQHVLFFLYIIDIALGAIAIFLALLFFVKYRKKTLLYFGSFIATLYLILLRMFLFHYYNIFGIINFHNYLNIINIIFSISTLILFGICGPLLIHHVLGIKVKKIHLIFYITFVFLSVFLQVLYLTVFNNIIIALILGNVIWIVTAYMLLLALVNIKRMISMYFKKPVFWFFSISLIHAVLGFFMSNFWYSDNTLVHPVNILHVIYFFILYSGSIVVSFKYLVRPPYMENEELTLHFISAFNISKREAEVLNLILAGKTNSEIAETLFISPKTVENHLTRIYQKTGTKNRYHCISMVNTQS